MKMPITQKIQSDNELLLQSLCNASEMLEKQHTLSMAQLSRAINKQPVLPPTLSDCDDILMTLHDVNGAIDLVLSKIRKAAKANLSNGNQVAA